ncbi:ABC transporter permease [Pelosinus sp. IPA-1]|uniref:ABC transporter permease n=1 Tax=Pelosinus sp. IPA-1 TaxID=3029569 RepID=UPI0024362084|nr:ABC transporter permease [Pelosinus sp. IPA-1]GMB00715.1 ABC transporter permease [Pelosinus sp. IPA-1]
MTFLIWKNLLHRKLQSFAILFSIATGVAIILCVWALYNGVSFGMDISKQRMGADIVIIPGGATIEPSLVLFGGAVANTYMPQKNVDAIRSIPGVHKATPQFFTHSLTADCHDIGTNNRMIGYDPTSDWIVGPWLKKLQKTDLKDNEVILGAKVPTWTQNKIMILGTWYDIVTVAEETGTTLDYSLFVSMAEARRVVNKTPALKSIWEKQGPPAELISTVLVQVDESANIMDIVTKIQQVDYVQTIVAADVKKRINDQFTVLIGLLGGIGLLVVLLSLFQLFSRFYTLTVDRQAEWGLYLALGASSQEISSIIVGEAVILAFAGSLAGLILGGGLYKLSLILLQSYQSFPFVEPAWHFFAIASLLLIGIFSALGALAAWLPAYRGSQVDPSTVMTHGEFN